MNTKIEVSIGELVDKLTILEIKKNKIKDPEKLEKVTEEFDILSRNLKENVISQAEVPEGFKEAFDELVDVNINLWEVEDKIREKEAQKSFRKEFIGLARKVYQLNDQRFQIKDKINQMFDSDIREQKSYVSYS